MLSESEPTTGLTAPGNKGWTTTAANGSFGLGTDEPVGTVTDRWAELQADLLALGADRLASAHQVHGSSVSRHVAGWNGWLRQRGVDGHVSNVRGTALAVTIADCTPVFIAHPLGIGLLHAGWRGTAAHILKYGLEAMLDFGAQPDECQIHLGPSICGNCYEVGPEVLSAVTGMRAESKGYLDVRAVLSEQAYALGVREIDVSKWCTKCGNGKFFSHRAGDAGRQLGVLAFV